MNYLKSRIFYIITVPIWCIILFVFMKYAVKWDNESYLKAQANSPMGIVEDRSPGAMYP